MMSATTTGLRRALAFLGMLALACAAVVVGPAGRAHAAANVAVQVGYADNLRANPNNFPTPWEGAPDVTYGGCTGGCTFDAGAVRLINNTGVNVSVDYVKVSFGTCVYDIWRHNVPLGPNGQYIITQTINSFSAGCTSDGSFDTSDIGPNGADWSGHCDQSGVVPLVTVSIDGVVSTFNDTGKILNTGGVDGASCGMGNESQQWAPVGSVSCPGSVLSLAPPQQDRAVGSQASVTANYVNSCGDPLQGAPITFAVLSGPNAGLTKAVSTDASGNATLTYTGTAAGTDTLQASTANPAGTVTSNTVQVIWQILLTGHAFGLKSSGLVGIAPTPEAGPVATTVATASSPPCVVTLSGLINAGTLCANVSTAVNPDSSTANASVQRVGIGLLGLPAIQIGAVTSTSHMVCAGGAGGATVASITVGGIAVPVSITPGPNTTVNVLGIKLILNEQIATGSGGDHALTVNAVHVIVPGLLDTIVASSTSDIHGCV
ncbi:Ig domain protein group 1 domain protein [Catenulispora acidiphila DSM 44928]|uniref:Ig domain protein group 1 domain protein n=1 Tax=Catenulispora acidiphila (strain DSM 44928 / JCM 14897 / NBRC 102108 / NRRL B-24433 / ID139908) TaxID=479433 RepID=C7QF58_CATAD|nr:choice-of-anchor P family protein [Catenulispora acidiphila]ACU74816.1 Ig domain protein group 1 domain protein [Catenulispora acidiphila DSM 44928]